MLASCGCHKELSQNQAAKNNRHLRPRDSGGQKALLRPEDSEDNPSLPPSGLPSTRDPLRGLRETPPVSQAGPLPLPEHGPRGAQPGSGIGDGRCSEPQDFPLCRWEMGLRP